MTRARSRAGPRPERGASRGAAGNAREALADATVPPDYGFERTDATASPLRLAAQRDRPSRPARSRTGRSARPEEQRPAPRPHGAGRYNRHVVLRTAALLLACLPLAAQYDVLIRNGRIADGAGGPWFAADLAVTGDTVAAIGKLTGATAPLVIDARGLVVAPASSTSTPIPAATFSSYRPPRTTSARA
jgi:hypothetical protein